MARTESTMLALGTPLPSFRLPDVVSGREVVSAEFAGGKPLLVMFMCRHCPYVKHVQHEIARIGRDYEQSGLSIVAISSNDAWNYPDDAPDGLRAQAAELGFTFPYCYDETQEVARTFQAACTPDFYLFGADGKLAYRGQLDGSRPRNDVPVSGRDLRAAMDAVLAGEAPSTDQIPSLGCNIKWKS